MKFDIAEELDKILNKTNFEKVAKVKGKKVNSAEKIFDNLLIYSKAFDSLGLNKISAELLELATTLDQELVSNAGDFSLAFKASSILEEELLKLELDPDLRSAELEACDGSIIKCLCQKLYEKLGKSPEYFEEMVEDYILDRADKQENSDVSFIIDKPMDSDMPEGNPEKGESV